MPQRDHPAFVPCTMLLCSSRPVVFHANIPHEATHYMPLRTGDIICLMPAGQPNVLVCGIMVET